MGIKIHYIIQRKLKQGHSAKQNTILLNSQHSPAIGQQPDQQWREYPLPPNTSPEWYPNLILFLDVPTHPYKRVCPLVGALVGPLVGPSIGRSLFR